MCVVLMVVIEWLKERGLDTPELVEIVKRERITVDNMKYLKDSDLMRFEVNDWNLRIKLLTCIEEHMRVWLRICVYFRLSNILLRN